MNNSSHASVIGYSTNYFYDLIVQQDLKIEDYVITTNSDTPEDFVIEFNDTELLNLTNAGNLTITGTLAATSVSFSGNLDMNDNTILDIGQLLIGTSSASVGGVNMEIEDTTPTINLTTGTYSFLLTQETDGEIDFHNFNNAGNEAFSFRNNGGSRILVLQNGGNVEIPIGNLDMMANDIDNIEVMILDQITPPSPTTDKLYNDGGNLTWNGTDISSASTPTSIISADTNTSITTEATADTLIMITNSSEAMRIDSSQDITIVGDLTLPSVGLITAPTTARISGGSFVALRVSSDKLVCESTKVRTTVDLDVAGNEVLGSPVCQTIGALGFILLDEQNFIDLDTGFTANVMNLDSQSTDEFAFYKIIYRGTIDGSGGGNPAFRLRFHDTDGAMATANGHWNKTNDSDGTSLLNTTGNNITFASFNATTGDILYYTGEFTLTLDGTNEVNTTLVGSCATHTATGGSRARVVVAGGLTTSETINTRIVGFGLGMTFGNNLVGDIWMRIYRML